LKTRAFLNENISSKFSSMKKNTGKEHRPNPRRAVKICGVLKDDAAEGILSTIARLRNQSADPLTLYIRSDGGMILALSKIEQALTSARSGAKHAKFITVAEGRVRSAAAYLLVMGDYAYAKNGVRISFHGARYKIVAKLKKIKIKDALAMAKELGLQNRQITLKLAPAMIYRVVHRFQNFRDWSKLAPENFAGPSGHLIGEFIGFLSKKLSSPTGRRLVRDSSKHARLLFSLVNQLPQNKSSRGHGWTWPNQEKIMQALLVPEMRKRQVRDGRVDELLTFDLVADYNFLIDTFNTTQSTMIRNLVKMFGPNLLTKIQEGKYQDFLMANPAAAKSYLHTAAELNVLALWYFTRALCRRLLSGENSLPAVDAYWLGLIDEVLDSSLVFQPFPNEIRQRYPAV
jgi:ATP-dependent protease ClpP protease subunit